MLTVKARGVDGSVASNDSHALWLNHHGGLELSDELTLALSKHGVRDQHVVVDALAHTDLCGGLVGHGAN